MNIKDLFKERKVLIGLGVLIIAAVVFGVIIYQNSKTSISFKLDDNVIEYGEDASKIDWKKRSTTNGDKVTASEIDTKKIGEAKAELNVCLEDTCKSFEQTIEVKDTKLPEIILKNETVEVTLGDEINTASNVESVKDPIDGDIKQSTDNTITKDGYFITADIKSEAGEYAVTVTAYDKNGNKAEKSYQLIIKEKSQEAVSITQPQETQSYQAPAQSNQSGGGNNASSSQPTQSQPEPSQPKFVCPNGNEPQDPSLPCDAITSGHSYACYKDASGNPVVFPTAEAAYTWAKNAWLSGEIEESYSSFATLPLGKNDGTECDCIVFE